MPTVERVVALHRVDLFADVPGRILAALVVRASWWDDLIEDPDDRWRSPWLRTCAAYARSWSDGDE